MSLNKTLDRLFDEIRREAKRNPGFADRLDAVLRLHESRRDVDDDVIESVESGDAAILPPQAGEEKRAPAINPVGMFRQDGEDALAAALATHDEDALRALVSEHNLDPSGQTETMDRDALAAHVLAQAKRRAERDEKLFDY